MELTKAQKAADTRAFNKAYAQYEMVMETANAKYEAELDRFCPIRDAYIAKLEAKRDAAIAKANAEYEEQYEIQMAQYEHIMKPAKEAHCKAQDEAWAKYVAPVINVEVN